MLLGKQSNAIKQAKQSQQNTVNYKVSMQTITKQMYPLIQHYDQLSQSEFSHHERVHPRVDAARFLQHQLLEVLVRPVPLLHQNTVLVELPHQILDQLVLERQLLQQQVLRERVHHYRFLQTVLQMVADQLQSLVVPVYHRGGTPISQRYLFLHVHFHRIELLYRFINDADRVLADHHVVLANPFSHVVHFILQLVQLVHQSFGFLLKSDSLKIERLLYALQRLNFVGFVLCSFIHAGHAHY